MSYSSLTRDTEKKPFSLRSAFGKAAAIVALAATVAFYGLGFNIGHAYYQQWQDNQAAVTQTYEQPRTENLPWVAAGATLAVSLSAGFTGIALGKKRDSYGGYSSGYSSSSSSNDGFFWGYMMGSGNNSGGSSGSWGSSSSSNDKGGAAAAIVIVGAVALAASASVVTYKAMKANFGNG